MIIWTIAKTTVGDAMRKKVLQIFLVVAIGLIVLSLSFSQTLTFSSREGAAVDLMLVKSFGLGLMAIAGALISLVLCVSLIPQEIERRTIYTILSKPVNRYEFIVGKFLGAVLTLAINIGLMGLVFILVITLKAKGMEMSMASVASGVAQTEAGVQKMMVFDMNMVWGTIMIYLQFLVLSSVVLLFSTFLTPTVNFFMGTAVYIIGIMASMTETMAKSEAGNAVLKWLYTIVHAIIPNFDKFNVTNTLLHPETANVNMGHWTAGVTLYALLYVVAMTTLAVFAFWKKEL